LLSIKFAVKFTPKDYQALNLVTLTGLTVVTFNLVTLNLVGLILVSLNPGKFDTKRSQEQKHQRITLKVIFFEIQR
jgi:hypothetical protein